MNDKELKLTDEAAALAETLDAMLEDRKLPGGEMSDELDMALKMKAAFSKPRLREGVDADTEALLLRSFANKEAIPEEDERPSVWSRFFAPTFAGAAVLAAVLLVVVVNPFAGTGSVGTLAEVQDFEALSEAEVLLGALPADTVTEDGLLVADLREDIHEMNVILTETDVSLDPDAELFQHVELRDAALTLVKIESDINQELTPRRLAMVDLQSDLTDLSQKASTWPKQNEGVSFETHEKAVNTFVSHGEDWQGDILLLVEVLLMELE